MRFLIRSVVKALDGNMPVSRKELRGLDLKKRLGMIAHSIIMHKRWDFFSFPQSLTPSPRPPLVPN